MMIEKKIEIIDSLPALYIGEIDAVIIADLHLGIEGILAEQGIFVPKRQFSEIISKIKQLFIADNIIIVGDLKHEFSDTTYHEYKEVSDLLKLLSDHFKRIYIVKGNHDNYIERVAKKFAIVERELLFNDVYLFFHGHKMPLKDARFKILAHEHPAVVFYNSVGAREKIPCFLIGHNDVILPAFSTIVSHSAVNLLPRENLLSPYLRERVDIDKFRVVGIAEGMKLNFPSLQNLKTISQLTIE